MRTLSVMETRTVRMGKMKLYKLAILLEKSIMKRNFTGPAKVTHFHVQSQGNVLQRIW